MKPIPVTKRTPPLDGEYPGRESRPVLAFDATGGQWFRATYNRYEGYAYLNGVQSPAEPVYSWEPSMYAVTGYEIEYEPIDVTHWLPLPDAPTERDKEPRSVGSIWTDKNGRMIGGTK